MSNPMVKIYYDEGESGPAEYLGDRLARIDADPLTDKVWRGDIVRISHKPGEVAIPLITDVVCQRFPNRSILQFDDLEELAILGSHLMLAGAELGFKLPPKEGKSGFFCVAHHAHLDPTMLAEALGFFHPDDEDVIDEADDLNDKDQQVDAVSQEETVPSKPGKTTT